MSSWTQSTRVFRLALWFGAALLLAIAGASAEPAAEPVDPLNRVAEFRRFDQRYDEHRVQYGDRIRAHARKLARLERDGKQALCAHQILREIEWLGGSTT